MRTWGECRSQPSFMAAEGEETFVVRCCTQADTRLVRVRARFALARAEHAPPSKQQEGALLDDAHNTASSDSEGDSAPNIAGIAQMRRRTLQAATSAVRMFKLDALKALGRIGAHSNEKASAKPKGCFQCADLDEYCSSFADFECFVCGRRAREEQVKYRSAEISIEPAGAPLTDCAVVHSAVDLFRSGVSWTLRPSLWAQDESCERPTRLQLLFSRHGFMRAMFEGTRAPLPVFPTHAPMVRGAIEFALGARAPAEMHAEAYAGDLFGPDALELASLRASLWLGREDRARALFAQQLNRFEAQRARLHPGGLNAMSLAAQALWAAESCSPETLVGCLCALPVSHALAVARFVIFMLKADEATVEDVRANAALSLYAVDPSKSFSPAEVRAINGDEGGEIAPHASTMVERARAFARSTRQRAPDEDGEDASRPVVARGLLVWFEGIIRARLQVRYLRAGHATRMSSWIQLGLLGIRRSAYVRDCVRGFCARLERDTVVFASMQEAARYETTCAYWKFTERAWNCMRLYDLAEREAQQFART